VTLGMPLDARIAGGLSLTSISRLERRFIEALRQVPAARVNLRLAVRQLVTELEAQHVSTSVARRLVRFVTEQHPDKDEVDRVSMITGVRESDKIMRQMMDWIDELQHA
jgi:hypothetical protein